MSTLPHRCLSSTTFVVEEVKIRRPVRAKGHSAEGTASGVGLGPRRSRGWRNLSRLDWRKRQGMTLRYVHAPDPKVVVSARGQEWSYPWDTAVLDILADVCNRTENRRHDH
jgi:hypothetical protein